MRLYRLGNGQVANAGLNPGCAVLAVDAQDAVEACQAEQDTLGVGQGAAGEPGSGPDIEKDDKSNGGAREGSDEGCNKIIQQLESIIDLRHPL